MLRMSRARMGHVTFPIVHMGRQNKSPDRPQFFVLVVKEKRRYRQTGTLEP